MTNKEYLHNNKEFKDLCQEYDVEATQRQVSKFRNKKGLLFKKMKGLI